MPVIVFLLATVTKFGNATVTRTMFQLLSQKSNNLSVRTTNIYICGIEILLTVEHPTWTPYKAQTTNYLILPRTLPSLTTEIDSQIRTWSYVGPGQWRQSGRLGVRAINVQVQRGVVRVASMMTTDRDQARRHLNCGGIPSAPTWKCVILGSDLPRNDQFFDGLLQFVTDENRTGRWPSKKFSIVIILTWICLFSVSIQRRKEILLDAFQVACWKMKGLHLGHCQATTWSWICYLHVRKGCCSNNYPHGIVSRCAKARTQNRLIVTVHTGTLSRLAELPSQVWKFFWNVRVTVRFGNVEWLLKLRRWKRGKLPK